VWRLIAPIVPAVRDPPHGYQDRFAGWSAAPQVARGIA
jgi:hypothetical protein